MQIQRNEIRTGLLVIVTLAALTAAIIYVGTPGVFISQKTFGIYFDNVTGLKQGAYVQLAGRKVGQVTKLFSPVPDAERPDPKMEAMVEIQVQTAAKIYNRVKVQMIQNGLLGEMLIDFTGGEEASGLAEDGKKFIGERPPGLSEIVPVVLERLDPVLAKAKDTFDSLQVTANNISKVTAEGGDLSVAFQEFKTFGGNLNDIAGPDGSLRKTLENIEHLTAAKSDLALTFANSEKFTRQLVNNEDLHIALKNFRTASDEMKETMGKLGPEFTTVGHNLVQGSDTLKRQPWRLIWPTTKSYSDENEAAETGATKELAPRPRSTPPVPAWQNRPGHKK